MTPHFRFVRTLRTTTSERFLLQEANAVDCAALDLHYLENGHVAGTLIVLNDRFKEHDIPEILTEIDEALLPQVSLDEGNLTFTVVRGEVIGSFTATRDSP
jgi:hypothetical protein